MPSFDYKRPLPHSWLRNTWTWLILFCATSLFLHLQVMRYVSSKRESRSARSPVDNYQHLHSHPVVNEDFLQSLPVNPSDNAIVTTMYNDAFAVPVVTLGHSLNRVNSTARRILLYIPDRVSERALCIATASGFEPYSVKRVNPPDDGVFEHFKDQFTKLTIWELDKLNVKAVVYLDADTRVLRNFDELFSLPFNFAAVPDVYVPDPGFTIAFNAGMLFIRTSSSVFRDLVSQINTADYPHWEAEQALLNVFYGAHALRLPYIYNGNLAIKKRAPVLWEGMQEEMRIIHYTLVKPFWRKVYDEIGLEHMHENVLKQSKEWDGLFKKEIMEWGDAWAETEETYRFAFTRCNWKQGQ